MSETRVPCRPSSPDARASGPRGGDLPGAAYRSWAFAPTWATARITAWGASLVRERAVVEERVVGRPVEAPAAAPPVAEVSELPQIQLRRGVSPQEMHDSMRRALRMRTVSHRILAFYLLEMHRSRAYQALGCASTYHYAFERLHLSDRRVRELLTAALALEILPDIDAALCKGELTWTQVLCLVTVATPTCEGDWLELARTSTYATLRMKAKTTRKGHPPRKDGDHKGLPEIRFPMGVELDPLTWARWESARAKLSAEVGAPLDNRGALAAMIDLVLATDADGTVPGRKRVDGSGFVVHVHTDAGGGLSVETPEGLVPLGDDVGLVAALRCEGQFVSEDAPRGEAPLPNGPTPPWMRRQVLARDGHRCRHCRTRTDLNAHHIVFREDGGPTVPANLVALCLRCHGLVHAKLLEAVGTDGPTVTFRATRPEGQVAAGADVARVVDLLPAPAPDGGGMSPWAAGGMSPVPPRVDGGWWRRHAPALRVERGGQWVLRGDIPPLTPPLEEAAAACRHELPPAACRREGAFAGLHGLARVCEQLEAHAVWAEVEREPFPHTLLMGPAGTGKTMLAGRIARRSGGQLVAALGGLLSDLSALPGLLAQLEAGDVLFLDEVHAVPRSVLEGLYQAMTDRELPLTIRQGGSTAAITMDIAPFTLVAATTDEALVPAAMASRFVVQERLGWYGMRDLAAIAKDVAAAQEVELAPAAALRLARAGRGTPREVKRLVHHVLATRLAELDGDRAALTQLDAAAVDRSLARAGYDEAGLGPDQRRYLEVLAKQPGAISLGRAAAAAGIPAKTILERVEPSLVAEGYVEVTPHGRRLLRAP